mmetsp:Transcript_36633/g.80266  ORF Transcript_36633/g.80266 Transcript_36633/m.80266 type:complete len:279 (+) Transcript_36633:1035-1871(+)
MRASRSTVVQSSALRRRDSLLSTSASSLARVNSWACRSCLACAPASSASNTLRWRVSPRCSASLSTSPSAARTLSAEKCGRKEPASPERISDSSPRTTAISAVSCATRALSSSRRLFTSESSAPATPEGLRVASSARSATRGAGGRTGEATPVDLSAAGAIGPTPSLVGVVVDVLLASPNCVTVSLFTSRLNSTTGSDCGFCTFARCASAAAMTPVTAAAGAFGLCCNSARSCKSLKRNCSVGSARLVSCTMSPSLRAAALPLPTSLPLMKVPLELQS